MVERLKKERQTVAVECGADLALAEIGSGESLLETLLENEIEISHSCGGMGTCGTCRVEILSSLAELHERNEIEAEMADSRAFEPHERLACQLTPSSGLKVKIPPSTDE